MNYELSSFDMSLHLVFLVTRSSSHKVFSLLLMSPAFRSRSWDGSSHFPVSVNSLSHSSPFLRNILNQETSGIATTNLSGLP